jgi:hypothetical protein
LSFSSFECNNNGVDKGDDTADDNDDVVLPSCIVASKRALPRSEGKQKKEENN